MGFMDFLSNAADKNKGTSDVAAAEDAEKQRKQGLAAGMSGGKQSQEPMLDASHPASQLNWQPLGQGMPQYVNGGDVPKDQVAQVEQGERVLTPEETQAHHMAAAGQAPDSMMGKIAERYHQMKDYATGLYHQGQAMAEPLTGEIEAIKNKQQQVNEAVPEYLPKEPVTDPSKMQYAPVPADRMHPGAGYGSRPGEKRPDPATGLPKYENGGTVPDDQVAQLDKGEHVLTPKDAMIWNRAENEVKNEVDVAPEDMKHEGVQAPGFGGEKAIPNPKGIKPMLDTDRPEQKPDQMYGAQMHTENAPSKPVMDNEKAPLAGMGDVDPKAQAAAAQMRLMSTGDRMNYTPIETPLQSGATDQPNAPQHGDVSADQARKEQLQRVGGPDTSNLPAVSPEHRAATLSPEQQTIRADQTEAMKSGDLMKLGMSNINKRVIDANAEVPLPTPTAPTARENVVNQKAAAKYKMLNGQTMQERLEGEKELAQINRITPLGSEGSRFPGVGGKILHGLSMAGQAALMGTAPYVLPMIPGSRENIAGQEAHADRGISEEQKEAKSAQEIATGPAEQKLKEAQAARTAEVPLDQQMIKAYDELDAANASQDTNRIEAATTKLDHLSSVKTAMLGDEGKKPVGTAGVIQHNKELNQMTQGMSPEQARKFEDAFSVGPNDQHAIATKRLEDAKSVVGLNESEKDRALQRAIAEKNHQDSMDTREDARQDRLRGKFYTYKDAEGVHLVQGNQLPEGAQEVAISNSQQFLSEARSGNIVQESLSKVYEDVEKHPEIFDNAAARNIMATTLEQIDRQAVGMLVAGTGGQIPMPSGMGDMINTALQNNALDKPVAEALKTYIADYKNMKDKAIVQQMEMQGGKIGRASQLALAAIINQIPNGSTPDSKRARQQLENMQRTQTDLMGSYPEKYQDYTKAKPYVPGQGAGAKSGAETKLDVGHTVSQGGKNFIIDAVDANGKATKWHPAP